MYVSHFEIIFFSGGRKRLKRWRQWFESSPPGWLRWRSSYWCATSSTSPAAAARPRAASSGAAHASRPPRRLPRNLTFRAGFEPSVCRRTSTTFPLEKGSFIPR